MRSYVIYDVIEWILYVLAIGLLIVGAAVGGALVYVGGGITCGFAGLMLRLQSGQAKDINLIRWVLMDKWEYTEYPEEEDDEQDPDKATGPESQKTINKEV